MYIKVRPSDFIRPPYKKCPVCGAEAFGVLVIASHQYSRRCRLCLFPCHSRSERHPPTRLPRLDKKLIYLDQFAISNMMVALNPKTKSHGRGAHEAFYRELFERLDVLCKKQLIVCPESEFHRYESLPAEYHRELKRMYELLGKGVRFWDAADITRAQVLEALRSWIDGKPVQPCSYDKDRFLHGDRTAWTDWFQVSIQQTRWDALLDELRTGRESVTCEIEKIFNRWQTEAGRCFDEWVKEEIWGLAKRYLRSKERQAIEAREAEREFVETQDISMEALGKLLPSDDAILMSQIQMSLKDQGVPDGEWLAKAICFFRSDHFNEVMSVKLQCMMWATVANQAANEGRKKPPTRGFTNDVDFISAYIPYCDAMFVDKECHGILECKSMRETVSDLSNAKIFSLRNKIEFLDYIEDIESCMTHEHVELIDELYGLERIKPYSGLYEAEDC